MALHRERGVADTTITEIAERAGVQRLTVYNHFPDEVALLEGCSSHWEALHPLPDASAWDTIVNLEQRLRTALRDLYAFFEETEPMTEKFLRDASLVPAISDLLDRSWHPYFREARDIVARATGSRRPSRSLLAAIALALDFHTWRTLNRGGLSREDAIDVAVAAVLAVDSSQR